MAIELAPDHVSAYALQLALDRTSGPRAAAGARCAGENRLAGQQDDGVATEQYRLRRSCSTRRVRAFMSLSSWARPGHESRYNAAYWARRAYSGIGAGAHSYDGANERSWNVRDLDAYVVAASRGAADRRTARSSTRPRAPSRPSPRAAAGGRDEPARVRRRVRVDPVAMYADALVETESRGSSRSTPVRCG